jgi:hypothetical protein
MGEWRPMINIEHERENWRRKAKDDAIEGLNAFLEKRKPT